MKFLKNIFFLVYGMREFCFEFLIFLRKKSGMFDNKSIFYSVNIQLNIK
jgi:hypothetical protein